MRIGTGLFLLFLLVSNGLFGQIKFFRSYTNGTDTSYIFQSVVETPDQGYMSAGHKVYKDISAPGVVYHGRGLIIKTDRYGNKEWERGYQYLNKTDLEFYDIKSIGREQFLVCGLLGEDIRGVSAYDFYVAKIDLYGNVIWQNIYPEVNAREWAYEIQMANDSVYYVTGWSDIDNQSVRLIKLDSSGNELWRKDYGRNTSEQGYALAFTKDEKIYSGGSKHISLMSYGYVVKADINGDTLWTRTYENTNDVRSIVAHDDGNFSFVGFVTDTLARGYLALCDSNGTMLWKKDFEDTAITWALSHVLTKGGNFMVSGISWLQGYDFAMVKTDATGNVLWNRRYHYNIDYGHEIIQASDNGFVLCGATVNNGTEAILLKTDSAGNSNAITTSVPVVTNKNLRIFPNPAHHKVYLDYNDELKISSVVLCDLSGKKLRTYDGAVKELVIDQLPSGLYLLKIFSNEGNFVEKLIVE